MLTKEYQDNFGGFDGLKKLGVSGNYRPNERQCLLWLLTGRFGGLERLELYEGNALSPADVRQVRVVLVKVWMEN